MRTAVAEVETEPARHRVELARAYDRLEALAQEAARQVQRSPHRRFETALVRLVNAELAGRPMRSQRVLDLRPGNR